MVYSTYAIGDDVTCKYIRNYDGDTITCNIPEYSCVPIVSQNMSIRLRGIDCPELRGTSGKVYEKALRAKLFTADQCDYASKIYLRNISKGKYFRFVADVYVIIDGLEWNLSELLVTNNLAIRKDY
jgi:endonuclease YncB( thermonuclease family)